jgi:TldD protein
VVKIAEENALLMAGRAKEPVEFAKTEVVKDTFMPQLDEDPRAIAVDEKLRLTEKYNSIALKYDKIVTTHINYSEVIREKYFISTEGTEIREDLVTTGLGGMITSKDGTLTQNVRVATGGSTGFALLRNREEEFEKRTSIAINLLKAKPVQGGVYNAILNRGIRTFL